MGERFQNGFSAGWLAWVLVVATALLYAAGPAAASVPPYLNRAHSPAERAADLIARMTLAEKAPQLGTTNALAIPRLGVQEYAYWSEALHGVSRFYGGDQSNPTGVDQAVIATSFPTNLSASLTWDPALVRRETSAISDEARGFLDHSLFGHSPNDLGPSAADYGSLSYFTPTINMDRDPRWGRVDEGFGEDPLLVGTLGSAYVEGFQGENARGQLLGRYLKAMATLKHYALYNTEGGREQVSSDTDEATIRDYYTRQFRWIIENADPAAAMSSYNEINGVPAVADNLTLNLLLRRTFGFPGYVTSDCGAVGTIYRAPNVPGTATGSGGHDWTPPGWSSNHGDQLAIWTHNGTPRRKLSARAGAEAWSLRAGTGLNCMGDPGQPGHPAYWDSVRHQVSDENGIGYVNQAIRARILGQGVIDRELLPVFTQRMRTGEFDPRRLQPYTRITKRVIQSPAHRRLARTVAGEALTLLQNNRPAGARQPLLPVDPSRVKRVVVIGDQANQVFMGDYSGTPSQQVSVLQGIRNALPRAEVIYDSAGSSDTSNAAPSLQPATLQAMKTADLIVVMIGTDANINGEGYDRYTLALSGSYEQLVQQVAAQGNHRIVLIDQSAGPVDLFPVRHDVASILYSAANGEDQGDAAADAIFGKLDPSGHLSFTWYKGDHQLPPITNYNITPSGTGGLGRTYMYFTGKLSWPFGFGMSYTTFRYSPAQINLNPIDVTGKLRMSFRVTNTGRRPGATVAQLYAAPPRAPGVELPRQRLVGFQRTAVLKPGQTQAITISVPLIPTLSQWNARLHREVVYPGTWEFRLASSANSLLQRLPVHITGQIPRTISTVALAPPVLTLRPGQRLALRARNRWLDGLAPTQYQSRGDTIISAVRRDDSFVTLTRIPMRFASNHPRVISVSPAGVVKAVAPGVATVSVTVGGVTASTPFVVRRA